jgi:hypothetical protein
MIKIPRKHHKYLEGLKYNDDSMKHYLFNTYGSKCCYCEASLAYFEIDHFYPKGSDYSKKRDPNTGKLCRYSLFELRKLLKKIIYTKKRYDAFENEQENLHLSCKRCNHNKSSFSSYALSPNYYFSKKSWKQISQQYLDSRFWYNYAEAKANIIYEPFIKQLKLNGSKKIEKALLQRRILYLAETLDLLNICVDLYNSKSSSFFDLFKIVACRFKKDAPFTTMIVNNLGIAFLRLLRKLSKQEIVEIKMLLA